MTSYDYSNFSIDIPEPYTRPIADIKLDQVKCLDKTEKSYYLLELLFENTEDSLKLKEKCNDPEIIDNYYTQIEAVKKELIPILDKIKTIKEEVQKLKSPEPEFSRCNIL